MAETQPTQWLGRPPPPTRHLQNLKDRIAERLVQSQFDSIPRGFLPAGIVDNLITDTAVMTELGRTVPLAKEDEDLLHFITARAKKVFAITIEIGMIQEDLLWAMRTFMDEEITDSKLPIIHKQESYNGSTLTRIDPNEYVWTLGRRRNFYEQQWSYLSPVFSTSEINYSLEPKSILPFVFRGTETKTGAFGEVFKVEIHQNHLEDTNNTLGSLPKYLAIKKIVPRCEDQGQQRMLLDWNKEVWNLRRVTQLKQEHIVRFITAFERSDAGKMAYYLLCEWADGGNLLELWRNNPEPTVNASLVQEMITQVLGLAKALCAVHYPDNDITYIRHGDLKPENILCFLVKGKIGILKLGDWGLAQSKGHATQLQMQKTSTGHGSILYEAPEVRTGVETKLGPNQNVRSRLYDVWAMGCIILEFNIWLLEGISSLNEFHGKLINVHENSPYYIFSKRVLGKDEPILHQVVTEKMDRLQNHPACGKGTALRDLLDLVKQRLLVVNLPEGLGAIERGDTSPVNGVNGINIMDTRLEGQTSTIITDAETSAASIMTSEIPIQITNYDAGVKDPSPAPKPREEPGERVPCRARAKELVEVLQDILRKGNDSGCWITELVNGVEKETISEEIAQESDGCMQTTDCDNSHHSSAFSIISKGSSGNSSHLAVKEKQNVSAVVAVPLINIEHCS